MNYTLTNNSTIIGDLHVDPLVSKLELSRTAEGVRWVFPLEVTLHGYEEHRESVREPYVRRDHAERQRDREEPQRELSWGMRGMTVEMCIRENNANLYLARGVSSDVIHAARQASKRVLEVPLYLSAQAVAIVERIRLDKDLELGWFFSAETFWLANDVYGYRSAVCQPYQFRAGVLIQRVPREAWISALRGLGLAENILVEVPLMRQPENEWRGVWDNLVAARRNFDNGMWNETVRRVRTALEQWQKQYKKMGKAWKLVMRADMNLAELDNVTKKDRLGDLLFLAKRYTDKAIHTDDDNWTRDDALLAINVCAALWNTIQPHD